jgi:hypothetical protein
MVNDAPPPGSWLSQVASRRLAVFAALAAVYVGVFSALFLRRIGAYFVEAAQTFEFARPWLGWLLR